ncbi:hypothetical protein SAMN06295967_11146 [Belliella buryatensis]|uniref:Cache domain-containing protein n=1 Tax=Belliella buryatensis TaxID=1500549 RepID=A0A239F0C2_9BACT|nr:cache domain-containing protein [Belliella buryatensis]SNS50339.1 hypothetical protein SAMN06295967_11146 [Belliella buryatensis]
MRRKPLLFLILFLIITACQPNKNYSSEEKSLEVEAFIALLDYDFEALEQELARLGNQIQKLYASKDSVLALADRSRYKIEGHYANSAPNENPELSTLYLPKIPNTDPQAVEEMLLLTNPLDDAFRRVISNNEVISQVYLNSKVQFNRLYPPYDAATMLDPDLDVTSYNFYYEADEVNNPERKMVWVREIYIDPVGKGWVVSLLNPVYIDDDLKMVLAFDISINAILDNYLSQTNRKLIILDEAGTVIAGKSRAIEALALPPLKNHTYIQTISSDSFRPEEYNLFKSKNKTVRSMISHFLLSGGDRYLLNEGLDNFEVGAYKMKRTGWLILDVEI